MSFAKDPRFHLANYLRSFRLELILGWVDLSRVGSCQVERLGLFGSMGSFKVSSGFAMVDCIGLVS